MTRPTSCAAQSVGSTKDWCRNGVVGRGRSGRRHHAARAKERRHPGGGSITWTALTEHETYEIIFSLGNQSPFSTD